MEKAIHPASGGGSKRGAKDLAGAFARRKRAPDHSAIEHQIGGLLERNGRAAALCSNARHDDSVPAGVRLDRSRAEHPDRFRPGRALPRFPARLARRRRSHQRAHPRPISRLHKGKTVQSRRSKARPDGRPRTVLTERSRIHSADTVAPLAAAAWRGIRLGCVVGVSPRTGHSCGSSRPAWRGLCVQRDDAMPHRVQRSVPLAMSWDGRHSIGRAA